MALKAHIDTQTSTFDERRGERRAMQLETSGTLPGGIEANVVIHNISATGMLIETELPLEQGESFSVELPDTGAVDATIIWQSDTLFGCAFAEQLSDGVMAAAQLQGVIGEEPPLQGALTGARRPPSISEPFGARLNRLRRERGLTLANVASALEVSKPTVWAWEKGKARPLPERIEAIAQALGVSSEELAESREDDHGQSIVEDCRLRIATSYGTSPQNIRIMIEI